MMSLPTLDQWQGCLAGVLVGDCLGFPYEEIPRKKRFPNTLTFIQDDLEKIKVGQMIPYERRKPAAPPSEPGQRKRAMPSWMSDSTPSSSKDYRQYTDDTSMTITLSKFLIESKSLDYTDLARRFTSEFIADKPYNRGYGAGAKKLLMKFKEVNFKDVFQHSAEQFNGQGSLGNGAGMRIAPVALYTVGDPDLQRLVDITVETSRLTHTHPEGIVGGIFQALAVRQALLYGARKDSEDQSPTQILDAFEKDFKSLLTSKDTSKRVAPYETGWEVYQERINAIRQLLQGSPSSWDIKRIQEELGNRVISSKSIPTAFFCFLASFEQLPNINTDNHFQKTLSLAYAIGGDTDTIGGMAGAICGAYVGLRGIPENFVVSCEAHEKVLSVAEQLYQKCNNSKEIAPESST